MDEEGERSLDRFNASALTPPLSALAILFEMVYVWLAMKNTLTVTQGQAQFPALCRRERTSAITRNGEVVAFVVPRQRMAGLLEEMEILANPEAMSAIERARGGKTVDHPLDVLDED
jgi:hypothetical protein